MECVERIREYADKDFDVIMTLIGNGTIKCGRYAGRIKIDKNMKINEKELFKHAKE